MNAGEDFVLPEGFMDRLQFLDGAVPPDEVIPPLAPQEPIVYLPPARGAVPGSRSGGGPPL